MRHRKASVDLADAAVLSGDRGIDPPQPRGDGGDLAHEVAKGIDEVDAGFMDKKACHLSEIGLPVEIGLRAPGRRPVAGGSAAHAADPAARPRQGAGRGGTMA